MLLPNSTFSAHVDHIPYRKTGRFRQFSQGRLSVILLMCMFFQDHLSYIISEPNIKMALVSISHLMVARQEWSYERTALGRAPFT